MSERIKYGIEGVILESRLVDRDGREVTEITKARLDGISVDLLPGLDSDGRTVFLPYDSPPPPPRIVERYRGRDGEGWIEVELAHPPYLVDDE